MRIAAVWAAALSTAPALQKLVPERPIITVAPVRGASVGAAARLPGWLCGAPGNQRVPSQDSRTTRAAAQSVPMNGNPARLSGRISDTNGRKPEYPAKALRELTSPQTRSLPSAPCAMWMFLNRTVGGSRSCSATSRWSVANDGSISAAVVVIAAGGQIAAPISAAALIVPTIGLFLGRVMNSILAPLRQWWNRGGRQSQRTGWRAESGKGKSRWMICKTPTS